MSSAFILQKKITRTIIFRQGKPPFRPGINFTVRRGDEWKQANIGEYVHVEHWDGYAEITKLYNCRLGEIPQEVLQNNHDPVCNTVEGEIKMYRKIYPDLAKASDLEIKNLVVTCIGFYLYPGTMLKE